METQFKKYSWIWIEGLQGAKDLNGKLGQIVKFSEEEQRYQIFIPGLDSNKDSLSKAILAEKQDDFQIQKLFGSEDQSTTGSQMKLIKVDNLKVYEGQMVECQYVQQAPEKPKPGPPFGRFQSYWYPREHPMFMVNEGNTPILNRCGFPLIIVRYPYNRQNRPQEYYDNQFGTYMLIDVEYGFAPPEWQSYVGPVLAYRPQIGGQSVQHFNSLDFEIVWDFLSNILDRFGEEPGTLVANRDFTFEKLRNFTENYCLNSQEFQPEVDIRMRVFRPEKPKKEKKIHLKGQNITRGEF